MKKFFWTLVFGSVLILSARARTKLVETVTRQGDEILIPYEKYVLDNGLTLIIHEDHSDPLVHVDVTYHVGSAREELNKSGFAHFFEHMLFQGSENVKDEEHFKIVTESVPRALRGLGRGARLEASEAIVNRLNELLDPCSTRVVLLYSALPSEANVWEVVRRCPSCDSVLARIQ